MHASRQSSRDPQSPTSPGRPIHSVRRLLAALGVATLVAACTGAAQTPAPTTQPTATPGGSTSPGASSGEVVLPPPELTEIRLGNSALDRGNMTYRFAMDLGLFEKYGITVTDTYFDGSGKLLPALIGGQVDVGINTPSSVLSSLATDEPLIMTSVFYSKMGDALFTTSDVKTADDLRGKPIAISSFGSESHAAVLIALDELGLTADDVVLQQIGGQQARIAALEAGSVAAAPIDAAREEELSGMGFNILVRLIEADLNFPRSGLQMRRDFMEQNPNTVLALTAALLEAQQRLYSDTEAAIETYMQWTQETDREAATFLVEDQLKLFNRDLRWTKEGWEFLKEVQITANPELADVNVEDGYTFQFLDQLEELGFNEQIGVPEG